jgi:rod shape-determining protein MreC
MNKIDENATVADGDLVVTSDLGGLLPKGMIIGTVVNTQVGDFGLTRTASIKPAAKLDHLTEVFVVVAPDVDGP